MSNFFETFLASLAGIATYYLVETLYYEVKARIRGRQWVNWVEDLEDDHWDSF